MTTALAVKHLPRGHQEIPATLVDFIRARAMENSATVAGSLDPADQDTYRANQMVLEILDRYSHRLDRVRRRPREQLLRFAERHRDHPDFQERWRDQDGADPERRPR